MPIHTATSICSDASMLVSGERAVNHGDKLDNHRNIADLWNAIILTKLRSEGWLNEIWVKRHPLSALDVANMMEALKIARRYSGAHNIDDYIDGAGYAGVAGDIAERMEHRNAHDD